MRRALAAVALLAAPGPVTHSLAAQVALDSAAISPAPTVDMPRQVLCSGQKISDIVILTQPPFAERLPPRVEFVRTTVRALHANTRDPVVMRYLLFQVGGQCTEQRRADSERILRAQPFLVDARIRAFDDGAGGVRLEVETRDDFSLVLDPIVRMSGTALRGLRFGDNNIAGTAIATSVIWRDGGAFDDQLGVRIADYQFAGQRSELRAEGLLSPFGNRHDIELMRPYYTDLQRLAWRAAVGGSQEHVEFQLPEVEGRAIRYDRRYLSVGGIARVGPMGQLKLAGLSVSREYRRTADHLVLLTDTAILQDTVPVPAHFEAQDVTRLNLLLGIRRFRFERVVGFDALAGAQDVRVGVQFGLLAGRAMPAFGSRDRDAFVSFDVFSGYGGQRSYVGMEMLAEGRRERGRGGWDNVLTSGRVAWYFRPAIHQLTLTQFEWAAGRNVLAPFQLTFRDRHGGMIGYGDSRTAGEQRLVMRAEHRMVFPSRRNVGDAGIALFAEAGRLWRGNAAYGMTTPVRGTVGLSLLAAIPPASRRLYRVDVGLPIGSDPNAGLEIRFGSSDRSRVFWTPPSDIAQARERTSPISIFNWPPRR